MQFCQLVFYHSVLLSLGLPLSNHEDLTSNNLKLLLVTGFQTSHISYFWNIHILKVSFTKLRATKLIWRKPNSIIVKFCICSTFSLMYQLCSSQLFLPKWWNLILLLMTCLRKTRPWTQAPWVDTAYVLIRINAWPLSHRAL